MNIEKPGFVEVTIDKARPDELPKIIGIYRQHNGNCKDVGCHNTFVARDQSGVAVGAITIERIQPDWTSLRTVGVEPELQRRGIGAQLVVEVAERLRREAITQLRLIWIFQRMNGAFMKRWASNHLIAIQ